MNITKHSLTAAALAAVLTVGGASATFAKGDDGTGSNPDRDAKISKICENSDQIIAKITERQARVTERITKLQEIRVQAQDAGRTKLVSRIDRKISHLQTVLERITTRVAMAPAWIDEHCS